MASQIHIEPLLVFALNKQNKAIKMFYGPIGVGFVYVSDEFMTFLSDAYVRAAAIPSIFFCCTEIADSRAYPFAERIIHECVRLAGHAMWIDIKGHIARLVP